MISKSGESIEIPQIRYPIQVIKQIDLYDSPKKYKSNFLVSSIDRKVMMIEINSNLQNLKFEHCVKEVNDVVTQMYYDHKSKQAYFGCSNGDIIKALVTPPANLTIQLKYNNQLYSNPYNSIITLYKTQNKLISWDLRNITKIIDPKTMSLVHQFTIEKNITCGISFESPYTNSIVGCIAFDIGYPPIIFDCQTKQKICNTFNKSIQKYSQQYVKDIKAQIITIADSIHLSDKQNLLVCGSRNQRIDMVNIYNIEYEDQLTFLQIVCKIQVKSQIIFLSLSAGIVMVSLYNSLLFFDVQSRIKQLLIEKSDLQVTTGFVLEKKQNSIKFMINKGFCHLHSQKNHKNKTLKLSIRVKNKSSK